MRGAPGSERHGLLAYSLLAYGVAWVALVGAFFAIDAGILDGEGPLAGLINQVAAAAPLIAAVAVIAVTRGRAGLAELGRSIVRWRVNPVWYLFAFVGVPVLMLAAMSLRYGAALLPALAGQWPLVLTRFPLLVLGVALVTGLAEEPGWRGYAQRWCNQRFHPLVAALVVSVLWALWHLPNAL